MKKILIIFSDPHLAYSPTTLQLKAELDKYFKTVIFCFDFGRYVKMTENDVVYARRIPGLGKVISLLKNLFPSRFKRQPVFYYYRFQLYFHLLFNEYDDFIYVDPISISLMGPFYKKGTLLSLELTQNTTGYLDDLKKPIQNIIIQSKARLEVFFDKIEAEVFYVQNAPAFSEDLTLKYLKKRNNTLVFGGTAILEFGIVPCCNFIKYHREYDLVIKGNIPGVVLNLIESDYKNEMDEGSIIIRNEYQNDEDYLITLSENMIGFAFYDLNHENINNINYITGPSGKMFKYFAAGVPVIASNLQGFSPISEFKAGVLIDRLDDDSILKAVNMIVENYEFYRENCFKAARFFSFDFAVKPYIDSTRKKLY